MNMARIRHIMAMRKALKAPPLLPPKIKSRERSLGGDTDKRTGPKDIIDVNLQIRDLRTELGSSRIVVCLFSESECGRDGPWKLVATSDAVPKNATIDIPEIFAIEYAFERSQFIKLEICDFTEQNAVVLGYATFLVSEVVCNSGEFSRDVTNEETGEFVAHMSITFTTRRRSQPVLLQFCGKNLSKKGMFGEPQLQFHLSRIEDSGDRTVIYKSELLCYSLKIQWKQFTVQNSVIADVRSRQLVVECYSQDDRGKRVLVGEFITDLAQLQASTTAQNVFFLTTTSSKLGRKTSGTFEVIKCSEMAVYSFLDYIVSGSLLHLAVAVDFSKAEQSPSHETTTDNTHSFVDDVEFVINAIVEPFRNYNFSNNYAAFGFGARIPPLYRESHEFCLNLETDPYCRGIDGIIDAFRNAYTQVQSINSAHFAHVIYYVSKLAENARKRSNQARPQYFVLIIITRGAIDDLREAIQAIIFASKAPLSIIFIGVGENNFMELERLGLSGARLAYHGRRADRDLLQFVSVSKFRTKDQSDEEARDSLVEKAIYQIPWQMATWMMKNGYIAQSTTSDDLSEHKLSVGSAPTPRRTAAVLRYDSLINSYSSSSEQLDTPTTSEGTQLVREARRRDSDEQSDTCSTSSCPNPRASSASMLLDERMTRVASAARRIMPLAGFRSLSIQSSPSGTFTDSATRQRRMRMPPSDICASPT